jgi:hypothetical protein
LVSSGEMVLSSLLEDCQTTLPPCPMVQTASGGFHRYLLVPAGYPIHPKIAIWPGIDILAAGSSVILPGSRTDVGEYRALRTFDECAIPEAPRQFVSLIRQGQKARQANRPCAARHNPFAEVETSDVSRRQWWLLFRNRVFRSFWKREGKAGDATDSAYEYHLAKACFCCGLNHRQAEAVILNWRRKHALNCDLRPRPCPAPHCPVLHSLRTDARGRIRRNPAARRAFVTTHPCPALGRQAAPAPATWSITFVSLKNGGADDPSNMQWQSIEDAKLKDRTE